MTQAAIRGLGRLRRYLPTRLPPSLPRGAASEQFLGPTLKRMSHTPPSEPVEHALAGGNMNNSVVRIGDRVHRSASPQTPTIHRLLAHVRAQGVEWVPRVHGFDNQGREVLDYLPGEVVHDSPRWLRDEQLLVTVASALREWHDATATFERKPGDVWWQAPIAPQEVICHVDFAPYNTVFLDRKFVGMIDFDTCTPGPRAWDLAYAAYRFLPLTPHTADAVADGPSPDRSDFGHVEQRRRLDMFMGAYNGAGRALVTAAAVLDLLPARLDAMADWCATQSDEGLLRNGVMYRAHARWIEDGPLLES